MYKRQVQVFEPSKGLQDLNEKLIAMQEERERRIDMLSLIHILATYHFSPTPLSRNNLIKESVDDRNIIITGNTSLKTLGVFWMV